jgi:precorrin-2 dehydrogenase/sirohydrochlorin ferrochelatase
MRVGEPSKLRIETQDRAGEVQRRNLSPGFRSSDPLVAPPLPPDVTVESGPLTKVPAPRLETATLFPIFLKLEHRPCLVVGGGPVGEAKVQGLVAAGADVRVVAPQATDAVASWARSGKIAWKQRAFEKGDLEGIFLVVVATSNRELNERIFQEARRRSILCNVVDDPPHCDFYYPAVVRRGDLQIAVSTNGHSPALAQRLKRELEDQFGPEYEAWIKQLGRARMELFRRSVDSESRRRLLHWLASRERFEEFVQCTPGSETEEP